MPLLDHFHPPLSRLRHWDSFHGAWAEAIARMLNEGLLPERYYAEARVQIGGQVEIDVGAFTEEHGANSGASNGGVAVWAPPRPVATAPLTFSHPELIEVQILEDRAGPQVVAALELVSPANKDRPSTRRQFAIKCAAYLQQGISVVVVDVVTDRHGNLHRDLLQLLEVSVSTPCQSDADLYATAYRTQAHGDTLQLDVWAEQLTVGAGLPTLPLWLDKELSVPTDLEQTYQAACTARRIA
jgi:Protein of unknown function (DUF4058)